MAQNYDVNNSQEPYIMAQNYDVNSQERYTIAQNHGVNTEQLKNIKRQNRSVKSVA